MFHPKAHDQIFSWLQRHDMKCLRCDGTNFDSGYQCELAASSGAKIHVVPIVCQDCGHMELFSAAVMFNVPCEAKPGKQENWRS